MQGGFSSRTSRIVGTTTCFFTPTNEDEIVKIISKLGSRKNAGHDNVKSDLIKQVAQLMRLLIHCQSFLISHYLKELFPRISR